MKELKDRHFYIMDYSEASIMYKAVSYVRNHFDEYKKTCIKIRIFSNKGGKRINLVLENKENVHEVSEQIKGYFSSLTRWDVMSIRIEVVKELQKV